jgi:hypothetical protein
VQWRVIVEPSSTVGAKQLHEVHVGGNATPGCSAAMLGLSLAEAKSVLAGLQRHLVQAQAEEHYQVRRRCPRCGGQRTLKDQRPRQLRSLFGTVEVRALPPADAKTIALSIDAGHVRAVRSYQVQTFEMFVAQAS